VSVHRLALLRRQLKTLQPLATVEPKQVCDRRTTHELAHQDRVNLILAPAARAHHVAKSAG
jgi:hypothetical protein